MLTWLGIAAAGILNGSFAVPMKTSKRWSFEQIWAAFCFLAMAVFPWLAVCLAIPGWRDILAGLPESGLARLIALGLVWGVASLLYGLAIDALGVALGFSIQLGLSIIAGALLPRFGFGAAPARSDAVFYLGLGLMVAGVVVCAHAGREDRKGPGQTDPGRIRRGLLIALAGGLGGPLLNVGIQYGITLLANSGRNTQMGQWVAWALFLSAATVTQSGYCLYRVVARGSLREYSCTGAKPEWMRVLVMAAVWAASIFLYGYSAAALGPLGTSVGWPVFIGLIVVTSNAWGVALGEWKGKQPARFRQMVAGNGLLIGAAFLVAQGR